jgi:hypothetical protein
VVGLFFFGAPAAPFDSLRAWVRSLLAALRGLRTVALTLAPGIRRRLQKEPGLLGGGPAGQTSLRFLR